MAKILNLDALPPTPEEAKREIQIGGVTHPILDMSVNDFIATTREAMSMAQDENATVADHMEVTIRMITRMVPTLTAADLGGYKLKQLSAIASFVRGEDPVDETAAPAEGDNAGK
jgi:hypothetical protein